MPSDQEKSEEMVAAFAPLATLERTWTQEQAVELCCEIERYAPTFGCHIALTGGCLYKKGKRKDLDLILYRIRQVQTIDFEGLFLALEEIGIKKVSGFGFCHKAEFKGKRIDILSPEEEGGYDGDKDNFDGDRMRASDLLL